MKKGLYNITEQDYEECKLEFFENVDSFYSAFNLNKNFMMLKYSAKAVKLGRKALRLGKSLGVDIWGIEGLLKLIVSHNNFLQFTPNIKDHHSERILRIKFKNSYN